MLVTEVNATMPVLFTKHGSTYKLRSVFILK